MSNVDPYPPETYCLLCDNKFITDFQPGIQAWHTVVKDHLQLEHNHWWNGTTLYDPQDVESWILGFIDGVLYEWVVIALKLQPAAKPALIVHGCSELAAIAW